MIRKEEKGSVQIVRIATGVRGKTIKFIEQ